MNLRTILLAAFAIPFGQAALGEATHHHYILIDLGTFGGPGSTPTEFQQTLNNNGVVVGGADLAQPNPYPNCFNPFNLPDCYVQHAFVRQNGVLRDLGTLKGGSSSFAYFVSNSGLIAGCSETPLIDPFAGTPEYRAILWSRERTVDLKTLGGTSSCAVQVNDAGQVIGFAQNANIDPFSMAGLGTETRAFLWQSGQMHDLGTLGGPDSFAQYVNERGQVAGVSYTTSNADPNTGLPPLDPFLWENGTMRDLGNFGGTNDPLLLQYGPFIYGFNNRGEVVGWMALSGDQLVHAFLWDGAKLSDLNTVGGGLGGNYSRANGLNDAGEVIGWATIPGDQSNHAVLWRNGAIVDLGTLHGDPCSTSESINSKGQIVGASQSQSGGCNFFTEAFLWENGGPMVDLNTLVPAGSPLLLTGAFWINDRGEITGRGVPPGCDDVDTCGHGFLLIPCDEDHPRIRGCDYALMEAESRPMQAAHTSGTAATAGALNSLYVTARLRYSSAKRYRVVTGRRSPRT